MTEPAGLWVRVSSGGQDEANQVPDNLAWVQSHGYDLAATYTVHGQSAFKGNKKFDEAWAQVLADMASGKITVLVVWKQDRIDRKLHTFQMLEQVLDAGGRVEFVTQPHLNDLTTMGGRISLKVQEEIAYAESKDKSDRMRIAFGSIQANGALDGRTPFGFTSEGAKYHRVMVPTKVGRIYVPQIFQRVIAGESLKDICAWLDSEGVTPTSGKRWWPKTLSALVRNPAYAGRRCQQDPRTRTYGRVLMRCEPLVDAATWKQANDALDSRPPRRPGGGGNVSPDPALLSGVLFCPACENSPMYRIKCGGSRGAKVPYYRCAGRGPQRQGCGNMVRVDLVDAAVHSLAKSTFCAPVMITRIIPGHDHTAELEDNQLDMLDVVRQGLPADQMTARMAALVAERDRLSALPAVPDEVVTEPSGETYWQLWDALSDAQRGPWLKRYGFRVTADKTMVKLTRDTGPWDDGYVFIDELLPPQDMIIGRGRVAAGVRLRKS